MLNGWKVLVLNADASPLQVSPWQEVIHLPLEELAFVREWARDSSGATVPLHGGGGRCVIDLPSVIQVNQYINVSRLVNFSRNAIYVRDEFTCQYCGENLSHSELTIDHVVPRHSLTGAEASTWGNCVASCRSCNARKGGRTLKELRSRGILTHNGRQFRLLKRPVRPAGMNPIKFLRHVGKKNLEWLDHIPDWRDYCRVVDREWLKEAYDAARPSA